MANLIKIGDRLINLDNVTEIKLEDAGGIVCLFNVADGGRRFQAEFADQEATAFLWWLTQSWHATDVLSDHRAGTTCTAENCEQLRVDGSTWCPAHLEEYRRFKREKQTVYDDEMPF
jgi:hypothetical protein